MPLSSRKIDRRVAWSVLIIFLIVAWILISSGSEPRYQGRALSAWLEDLDQSKAEGTREHAKAVLTRAAREAAPTFVKTLRTKDSQLKLMMIGLVQRQKILKLSFRTADMRHDAAVAEFSRFRIGAIPVLTNLLDDPRLAVQATSSLSGTGPEAAVHLIGVLSHTNDSVRICAALGLNNIYMNSVLFRNLVKTPGWQGDFPTNATVAALVKHLKDKTPNVRVVVAFALGNMREQPESVIPAFTEGLEETTNSQVRQAVADALGKYAQQAVSAVPSLERLVNDTDPAVRTTAERALSKIK